MGIVTLIVILIVVGVLLQLVKARIDPTIYTLILVVIVLAVCLLILHAIGLFSVPGFRLK